LRCNGQRTELAQRVVEGKTLLCETDNLLLQFSYHMSSASSYAVHGHKKPNCCAIGKGQMNFSTSRNAPSFPWFPWIKPLLPRVSRALLPCDWHRRWQPSVNVTVPGAAPRISCRFTTDRKDRRMSSMAADRHGRGRILACCYGSYLQGIPL
jgi:hypothetical protein